MEKGVNMEKIRYSIVALYLLGNNKNWKTIDSGYKSLKQAEKAKTAWQKFYGNKHVVSVEIGVDYGI